MTIIKWGLNSLNGWGSVRVIFSVIFPFLLRRETSVRLKFHSLLSLSTRYVYVTQEGLVVYYSQRREKLWSRGGSIRIHWWDEQWTCSPETFWRVHKGNTSDSTLIGESPSEWSLSSSVVVRKFGKRENG